MPYMKRHRDTGFIELYRTPEEKMIVLLDESNKKLQEENRLLRDESTRLQSDLAIIKEKLGLT